MIVIHQTNGFHGHIEVDRDARAGTVLVRAVEVDSQGVLTRVVIGLKPHEAAILATAIDQMAKGVRA